MAYRKESRVMGIGRLAGNNLLLLERVGLWRSRITRRVITGRETRGQYVWWKIFGRVIQILVIDACYDVKLNRTKIHCVHIIPASPRR